MRPVAGLVLLLAALRPGPLPAVSLDALETHHDWRLGGVRVRGNRAVGTRDLRQTLVTRPRPWYTPWRPHPPFDPVAFRTDLERVQRLYESRGYYHARVTHDLELRDGAGDVLRAVVSIDEGPPVVVERVDVRFEGAAPPPAALTPLPLAVGAVFTQDAYDRSLAQLRAYYREHGYARVEVAKSAHVDLDHDTAAVVYRVDPGPTSTFGAVRVTGTAAVDPAVVRREIAFTPGDPFRQSALDRTRENLTALNLFRTIRLDENPGRDPRVDTQVHVVEAPRHEVRLGVGYDTEEQVRGIASWRDYDFLGGARQLGFTARLSLIRRTLAADFLQPHFPGPSSRTRLLFAEQQEEEDTYRLDRTRMSPRLEWQATPAISGFAFYRAEYDSLASVSDAVRRRLPHVAPSNSVVSGLGFGADWNTTDNLLDPSRGWVASATVEPVGGVLGGDVSFVRVIGEGRVYQPLVGRLLGAARLRVGAADPTGGSREIPLFERFYAGGINSVRGYDRRRVGPLVRDEPVGGRTTVEGSIELRHPLTDELSGAVFLDGGQVSTRTFDFPFGRLRYGTGVGALYRSPVGPLKLYLGFPLQPPDGDSPWQVHVSVGATF